MTFATDTAPTNLYNEGDSFAPYVDDGINPPDDSVINDLTLYFLPKFAGGIGQAEAVSISNVGTVEHIFFQVPSTGDWEFWVVQEDIDTGATQDYAVAWWAKSAAGPTLSGDFNNDGMVDGADLAEWKTNFGTGPGADADGDGDSDGADFLAWQQNFGATAAVASAAAVPEPTTIGTMLCGMAVVLSQSSLTRRRRG